MMNDLQLKLQAAFGDQILHSQLAFDALTLVIAPEHVLSIATRLRDEFQFEQLIDIAGIDYSKFGLDEWETQDATSTGFSRGVASPTTMTHIGSRFALSYQLLSYKQNLRLQLKCFLHDEWPEVQSLTSIWPAANWFEREAFDLFGIIFRQHPDLRRILTDYGFIGHPFRKDFPLSGQVEVRYDAALGRVVYEPVEIEPRTLVPKVIRHDNRYLLEEEMGAHPAGVKSS